MALVSRLDLVSVIRNLSSEIGQTCEARGFRKAWNQAKDGGAIDSDDLKVLVISQKLQLISDEVTEAHEVLRNNGSDRLAYTKFTEELADIVIRVLDLADMIDANLASELLHKISSNKHRPELHGRKF